MKVAATLAHGAMSLYTGNITNTPEVCFVRKALVQC